MVQGVTAAARYYKLFSADQQNVAMMINNHAAGMPVLLKHSAKLCLLLHSAPAGLESSFHCVHTASKGAVVTVACLPETRFGDIPSKDFLRVF